MLLMDNTYMNTYDFVGSGAVVTNHHYSYRRFIDGDIFKCIGSSDKIYGNHNQYKIMNKLKDYIFFRYISGLHYNESIKDKIRLHISSLNKVKNMCYCIGNLYNNNRCSRSDYPYNFRDYIRNYSMYSIDNHRLSELKSLLKDFGKKG